MYSFFTVSVVPEIPEKISRLKDIAYNFWFSWNEAAQELFSRIDRPLWEEVYHNPVKFLLRVRQEDLERASCDKEYLKLYGQSIESFDRYLNGETWFKRRFPEHVGKVVAYFSAEFGLHESHPIYSGGLGLLAGDHLKSASDLGVPLVGVGLLYRQGYFTQRINGEGWQEADYPLQNFFEMPMMPVMGKDGGILTVPVELPGRKVHVRVWQARVGKVSLFLLDSDVASNSREDRVITAQLYGGCREMRISQEIILGIGGVRALRAMDVSPRMWHINEGHAAFLCLERIRELVGRGIKRDVAVEAVRTNTLFTTHTPVPAGHDVFTAEMMDYYFGHYAQQMDFSREDFIRLGWDEDRHAFNMTVLALNLSDYKNGVSKLHGSISRTMFRRLYGNVPAEEVPISSVTNGVHLESWMAPQIKSIMRKYAGNWWAGLNDPGMWAKIDLVPDEVVWSAHRELKEELIEFARGRLRVQRERNFETRERIAEVDGYLNADALIIGFARRFATYKRATLLFSDLERLSALMNDPRRPVQIIFAGKAHPADRPGQELIKRVLDIARLEPFRGKIVFLENYDINVARHLVRGVDIWLNNPRRPQEASGTSGMKAAVNGVVNFSILDGWWPEAYNGRNGFSIGLEKDYPVDEIQDREDFLSLLNALENDIVPTFFDRASGVPQAWVAYMKNSIKTVGLNFSSDRMVREYTERYYVPATSRGEEFRKDNFALAEKIEAHKSFLKKNWHQVSVCDVGNDTRAIKKAGDNLSVNSTVRLGAIQHHNVSVEIVYGGVEGDSLYDLKTVPMTLAEQVDDGVYCYRGNLTLPQGAFGFTVRVRPSSNDFVHKFDLPLVVWAGLN
jgi:starch phosphorylase